MPEIVYTEYDIHSSESYLAIFSLIISTCFFIIFIISSISRIYSIKKYSQTDSIISTLNGISILISLISGVIGLIFNAGLYLKLKKHNDIIPNNGPLVYKVYNNINKYKIFTFILIAIIAIQILYLIFNWFIL